MPPRSSRTHHSSRSAAPRPIERSLGSLGLQGLVLALGFPLVGACRPESPSPAMSTALDGATMATRAAVAGAPAAPASPPTPIDSGSVADLAAADPHAHHRQMMMAAAAGDGDVKRSEVRVALPAVSLVRQDGLRAPFAGQLDDGRAVILDFIFTSCTSICPMSSQVLSQVQAQLGEDQAKVHFVSVSIDPEFDTPARLVEYAARFHAGAGWSHYTGSLADSVALQKAFGTYRGDKMNHLPVTFLRRAPGEAWVRLDGFARPGGILATYRALTK